jgi:hypothetical protein
MTEWLKVLWSDEVTFFVGGRTMKQRVTRKAGERYQSMHGELLGMATRAP